MDTKTYVGLMASVVAWICFLVVNLISFLLVSTPTHDQFVREKLGLVSIGINAGIARVIMEYIKNNHQVYWKKTQEAKRLRDRQVQPAGPPIQDNPILRPLTIELVEIPVTEQPK